MNVDISFPGGVGVIQLKGSFVIDETPALKQSLLDLLNELPVIEIDLSEIADIDSAGLQLLVFAKRESVLASKCLRFTGVNPSISKLVDLFGLNEVLVDNTEEVAVRATEVSPS